MPKSKVIVIWGKEDILSSSIEVFLKAHTNWKVIRIPIEEYPDTLIQVVGTVRPDIVIIQQGCHNDFSNVPLGLMQNHPTLTVITMSLENNLMEVFNMQKKLVEKTADLIKVIESNS